jgi:hypothetical protein
MSACIYLAHRYPGDPLCMERGGVPSLIPRRPNIESQSTRRICDQKKRMMHGPDSDLQWNYLQPCSQSTSAW